MKRYVVQHGLRAIVAEVDIFKIHVALDRGQRDGALADRGLPQAPLDFMGAFQSSQRFRELRADLNNLHHGRDQETHERGVSKESANRQRSPPESAARRQT